MMDINWLAVALSTVSAFVLGGLWYSPLLFHKPWLAAAKLTVEETQGNMGAVFAQAILFALITAVCFGSFVGPAIELKAGLAVGAATGAGLVAASFGLNYAFERRSLTLLLINGGYAIVQFTLYGLIFALV